MNDSTNNKLYFSVVITFFNQSKNSLASIDSLKAQTYKNFECIIVDDGSTNDILMHINNKVKDDKRFTVTSQKHHGVSYARNNGLRLAKGDYIIFLDADDTLNAKCLDFCNNHIDTHDLIIFGIDDISYKNNKISKRVSMCPPNITFKNGNDLASWYVINKQIMLYSCGNKMYKLNTIKSSNIKFDNKILWGEDRIFNYQYLKYANKIQSFNKSFYNYRHINNQSLTQKFINKYIDVALSLHKIKMDLLLPLADNTTDEQKYNFRLYDIRKEVANSFRHLACHKNTIDKNTWNNEFEYLNTHKLSKYFYEDKIPTATIIEFINDYVFPKRKRIDSDKFNVVIILGSKKCKYRIKKAKSLFKNNKDIVYICTGGNKSIYKDKKGQYYKEALFMRHYLLNEGVDRDKILCEDKSSNTFENLKYTKKYIAKESKVAVVTAAFHAKRVEKLLPVFNIDATVIPVCGRNSKPSNWFMFPDIVMSVFYETYWFTNSDCKTLNITNL